MKRDNYKTPSLDLLNDGVDSIIKGEKSQECCKEQIVNILNLYNIEIERIKATVSPLLTLYELVLKPGVRLSLIREEEEDIALSIGAVGVRFITPIPGKGTIGIEVPNQNRGTITMKSIVEQKNFQFSKLELPIAIGETITGKAYILNLANIGNLIIAGSNKHEIIAGLDSVLVSLLLKHTPNQIRFMVIEGNESSVTVLEKLSSQFFVKMPDKLDAVITNNDKVESLLGSLNEELDRRYEELRSANCRNISQYNKKAKYMTKN